MVATRTSSNAIEASEPRITRQGCDAHARAQRASNPVERRSCAKRRPVWFSGPALRSLIELSLDSIPLRLLPPSKLIADVSESNARGRKTFPVIPHETATSLRPGGKWRHVTRGQDGQ